MNMLRILFNNYLKQNNTTLKFSQKNDMSGIDKNLNFIKTNAIESHTVLNIYSNIVMRIVICGVLLMFKNPPNVLQDSIKRYVASN